jgi:signal transduction histidine kinase
MENNVVSSRAPAYKPITDRLVDPLVRRITPLEHPVEYYPFPHSDPGSRLIWRVRFEFADDPAKRFGLDLNDEVILGRGSEASNVIDLGPFDATRLGVSRHHLMLQPTSTALYVVDLGSTNGTQRNGQSIGVRTPYSLANGDTLTLGRLSFLVSIIERPRSMSEALQERADLADALSQVAKAITSQQELDEVLKQMLETAMALTESGETSIWLVEEQTGALFLEAQRGLEDEAIRRMRQPLTDGTLAGQVFFSGRPLRASRKSAGDQIDISHDPGRPVEALIYVPLKLGGTTFGVLSAAHRDRGKQFSERDERILTAVADFASIAIVNARLFEQLDRERDTVRATVNTLHQPLIILDDRNLIVIANSAAQHLLDHHGDELTSGLRAIIGQTAELQIAEQTYITTTEHVPGIGTIVVMQDITYVKQLEHDRSEMLHALTHDLKTPLTSIKGWAHLLPRVTELDERGEKFVSEIIGSVDRMVEMIGHLLNTARMTDLSELALAPCQLEHIVQSVVNDLGGAALAKPVTLCYEVYGEPFAIVADEARLYHMALNLVDNAIKYTVEDTSVYVTLSFGDEAIALCVADEGNGIPEAELGRVFDKYYRGANHRRGAVGVGLGLSVVQGVARAHGGQVSVRNRDEGGAAFTVTLPVTLRCAEDVAPSV